MSTTTIEMTEAEYEKYQAELLLKDKYNTFLTITFFNFVGPTVWYMLWQNWYGWGGQYYFKLAAKFVMWAHLAFWSIPVFSVIGAAAGLDGVYKLLYIYIDNLYAVEIGGVGAIAEIMLQYFAIPEYTENDEVSLKDIESVQQYYGAWIFITISSIQTSQAGTTEYLQILIDRIEQENSPELSGKDEFDFFEPINENNDVLQPEGNNDASSSLSF